MKFFHHLLGFLLFVILIALFSYVGNAAILPGLWARSVQVLTASRLLALCGTSALLFLIVLYLLTGVKRKPQEKFISFDNEGGSVSISMRALHDYLVRLGDEFAAIIELKPAVRGSSEGLDVEADIKVRSGTQVQELCRLLQARIKESIRDELGLSEVKSVKVNIRDIVAVPSEKKDVPKQDEAMEWEGSMRL